MSWLQVVVLSVVQGLTEFLPVSSSGHLAITSRVFFADDAGASFTAVTQLGTELAVLVYFAQGHLAHPRAWFAGLFDKARRTAHRLPAGLVRHHRHHPDLRASGCSSRTKSAPGVRNLWVIATALMVFSAVIAAAEYFGRQTRDVEQLTWRDGVDRRPGPVPGAGARGVPVRRDHQRRPVPRARTANWPPGSASCWPFRRCSPRGCSRCRTRSTRCGEGMSATGPQLLVATAHRVRGRLRRGGLVPAIPGAATACTGSSATGRRSARSCWSCWPPGWWPRQ